MKVLAFEDSFDIAALLTEAGVDLSDIEFRQHWNTMDALDRIEEFEPDVLLLDHWIPPTKGLDILRQLLELSAAGQIERPVTILAISSSDEANEAMLYSGADGAIAKFALAEHEIWVE